MWDFFVDMAEYGIQLKLDDKWNGHAGFQINKEEVFFFIGLLENFIDEKGAHSMILSEKYLDWDTE